MGDDDTRPTLSAADTPDLERAFEAAVATVLDCNVVPGRGAHEPRLYLRAGGGYPEPWTRDAAINALQAGAPLCPDVARDTLTMVCDHDDDGAPIIARDNQWWDSIIWVLGAWRSYLVTGDEDFLETAFGIGVRSLAGLRARRFDPRRGLFEGPAVMQDGISGYPDDLVDAARASTHSFVLDHPATHRIACLSTNLVYLRAHRELLAMADELDRLGRPSARSGPPRPGFRSTPSARRALSDDADALATAIERTFWDPVLGRYRFLNYPDGRVDASQEGLGLAFAALAADDERAAAVVTGAHRQPRGVVNLWPHVQGYSDDRPGRHNALLWPMVMGFWAQAVARTRDEALFGQALGDIVSLVAGSGFDFFETYDAVTGAPHGGWQTGAEWESQRDQTWSATAYIGAVVEGLIGIRFLPCGLAIQPLVPPGTGPVALRNLRYRHALLTVDIRGHGATIWSIRRDGVPINPDAVAVPADATGPVTVEIELRPER
ncbi:MAG: hypothetical protein IPJ61_02055 [Tessaracoccus sp.]|uniref:MGH1-like glycoside hydrolase domain-containing protein n=1 Tax=Tessaracoccus sp. TaxID=1971211 RepID=UPI001EB0DA2F|nr:hypothetical protein [Tessaracoccus sp.]MBK7819874.1 hypothetical protein [Tessaracoccus sp.]